MTEEMGAEPIEINIDAFSQLTQSPDKTGLHFYPHRVKGEGFFISALQKTDGHPSKTRENKKSMVSRLSSSVQKEIAPMDNKSC
jgi:hypothetical protein